MSSIKRTILNVLAGAIIVLSLCSFVEPPAENPAPPKKKKGKEPLELPDMSRSGFKVSGGQMVVPVKADSTDRNIILPDSIVIDSLTGDTLRIPRTLPPLSRDSIRIDSITGDTIYVMRSSEQNQFTTLIEGDSVVVETDSLILLRGNFEVEMPDTTERDTTLFPLSYMTLVSAVVPGFGQFYNKQYWKIPVMWAAIGTPLYFGIRQHKIYSDLKAEYNTLLAMNAPRSEIDPVQGDMIMHNTWRQLLFGGALAAYVYTLYDAVTNYPAETERIRMATTLSFVCPGLGQLYNGSYWKLPLFIGGFATFGYMIDWNNRGYVRYDTAYRLQNDDDPNTQSEFELSDWPRTNDELKRMRTAYRRNRDLCIIVTAIWYFINVLDAHVDAQLKDYDISDDLAQRFTIEPVVTPMYASFGKTSMSYGIGIGWRF